MAPKGVTSLKGKSDQMTYWLIREDPFSRARRTQERARLLKKDSVGSASRALLYSSTSDFLANPSVLRGAGTAVQQVSKSPGSIDRMDDAG